MPSVRERVSSTWAGLADLPVPLRYAIACGAVLGTCGGAAGLVVGLRVHPATAWFAIIELGTPAGLLGGLLGLVVGTAVALVSRLRMR